MWVEDLHACKWDTSFGNGCCAVLICVSGILYWPVVSCIFFINAYPLPRAYHAKSGPGQNQSARTSFGSQKWSYTLPKNGPRGGLVLVTKNGSGCSSFGNWITSRILPLCNTGFGLGNPTLLHLFFEVFLAFCHSCQSSWRHSEVQVVIVHTL